MDTSQYTQIFITEAREHLDNLNEYLVILEKEPSNADNLNKIFRAFHTLKGNAASLGFVAFSETAHSLEDALSQIRQGELKVTPEIMTLIFEGCDLLETGLDEIGKGNPENIDANGLIAELKVILGVKEQVIDTKIEELPVLSDEQKARVQSEKDKQKNVFRVIIIFDRSNTLRIGKALLVLRNMNEVSETIYCNPSLDDVKQGKFGTQGEVLISTTKTKEELIKVIDAVSGIKHCFVLGIDEKYIRPVEDETKNKEIAKVEIANQQRADVSKQIQSVRVNMGRLDKLMNLVGELLVSNIRLQEISKQGEQASIKGILTGIDRLIMDLHDEVMEIRMVPIGSIFNRFPRMVRDLATKENKKINLVIEGEDIEFDRSVLDRIGDPLVHLLRNCVDHGIESPEERLKLGKPEEGTVWLIARREKNSAIIEVKDDGSGIDPKKVAAACVRKGLATNEEIAKMDDNQIQLLIFRPGASTNEVVTEVSGRGVGMDVVMSKTKEMGGSVKLDSKVGKGTSLVMQLPLTVAIITCMVVKVKNEVFAIPLTVVEGIVKVNLSSVKTIKGFPVFIQRGRELPLFWLQELMGFPAARSDKERFTVIIINRDDEQIGVVVDHVIAQQQLLIKALPDVAKKTKGIAGATILGDGSVALIVDVKSLIQ